MLDARSNHPGFKVVPKTPEPSNRGLLVDGVLYQLVQFHFHSPSEHVVNGVIYPLEMHMVRWQGSGAGGTSDWTMMNCCAGCPGPRGCQWQCSGCGVLVQGEQQQQCLPGILLGRDAEEL